MIPLNSFFHGRKGKPYHSSSNLYTAGRGRTISERDSKSISFISMLWCILGTYNYINILALVHPKHFTVYIWTWKEGTKAYSLPNPLGLLFGMESTHIFAKLLDIHSRILQYSLRIQETKTLGFHRKVTKSTGILCTNSLVRIINAACAL